MASPLLRLLPRIALADIVPARRVRERRMRFGTDRHQYVLTFVPEIVGVAMPFVHFLHGGGWSSGSARRYAFIGRFLAAHGIPSTVCGYRLAPYDRWPAQLHDAAKGLAAALEADAELRARPVVLGGYSAGGHIAAVLALDPVHLEPTGVEVSGLLAVCAPLDLGVYETSPLLQALTGHKGPWPEVDPVQRLADGMPPALVISAGADRTVPPASASNFVSTAEESWPGQAELLELPRRQHSEGLRLFLQATPEGRHMLEWIEARA